MPVEPITPIHDTSQAAANQALEEYLAGKKINVDEQADKTAKIQDAIDVQEAKKQKIIDDVHLQEVKDQKIIDAKKFQEAKALKEDQEDKYQIKKETNKHALETKNAKMDALTNANASHFHAAEVNSKAAQDKASATIEHNTAVLEDFLAAKTTASEVNRRADNAAASEAADTNILNSKLETEQAVEAYHDNMATQSAEQQAVNATEAARLAGAATQSIRQDISPAPHINIMD